MSNGKDGSQNMSRRMPLKEKQSCAVCAHFEPPNACKFVQGTISPSGWCMLFAPKT